MTRFKLDPTNALTPRSALTGNAFGGGGIRVRRRFRALSLDRGVPSPFAEGPPGLSAAEAASARASNGAVSEAVGRGKVSSSSSEGAFEGPRPSMRKCEPKNGRKKRSVLTHICRVRRRSVVRKRRVVTIS